MKRTLKALAPVLCAGMALGGFGVPLEQAGAGDDGVSFSISYGSGYESGYGSGYNSHDRRLAGTLWVGGQSYRVNTCDDVPSSIARLFNRIGYSAEVCEGQVRVRRRDRWRRMPSVSWSSGAYRASIYGGRDCLTITLRRAVRSQYGPRHGGGYDSALWGRAWRYERRRTTYRNVRPRRHGRDYYRDGRYNRCD